MQNVRFKMLFYNLSLDQNKRVTIIELRNRNEQNVISYSQLRKSKIFFVKKFQTTYLFPTLYLKSKYIWTVSLRKQKLAITNINCKTKYSKTQIE